jgi:hypothetical protein
VAKRKSRVAETSGAGVRAAASIFTAHRRSIFLPIRTSSVFTFCIGSFLRIRRNSERDLAKTHQNKCRYHHRLLCGSKFRSRVSAAQHHLLNKDFQNPCCLHFQRKKQTPATYKSTDSTALLASQQISRKLRRDC